ncbi:LOW QUALITY PROTEIN: olfactory receptor 2K2 [Thomomys bottae]
MQRENFTAWSLLMLEGFSQYWRLQLVLFVFSLVMYLTTLLVNSTLILITVLNPHLQTPMYLFLRNLSSIDICYTSAFLPTLLVNLLSSQNTTHFSGCAAMYIALAMGSMECVLLAVMAYDRHVAICNSLRYAIIMERQVCVPMVTVSWVVGCLTAMLETSFVLQTPFCGNLIHHSACEIVAVLKLACTRSLLDMVMPVVNTVVLPIPMLLICIPSTLILSTILKMSSAEGRNKAFSTCGAHLTVVIFYHGASLSVYLKPSSANSQEIIDKIITFPTLNPIIYSLRNKEVRDAVKKWMGQLPLHQTHGHF